MQECMKAAGLDNYETKILCWFINNHSGFMKDIEHNLRLPQPIVSIVTRKLEAKNYITHVLIDKPKQGRPKKLYKLKLSKFDIFQNIASDISEKINQLQEYKQRALIHAHD